MQALVNSVVGTLVTKGTPDGSKKGDIWSYACVDIAV